ncbi:MAG: HEAT repeat domain-containing protein, partial [Planctomycetota bacterium]
MKPRRLLSSFGILVLSLGFSEIARAGESGAGWPDLQKRFRKAFKPLRLPPPRHLDQSLIPALPAGIVIEPGPFDALIRRLMEPYKPQHDLRGEVMAGLGAHASPQAGKAVKDALKILTKENKEIAKRLAEVEKKYSGAYNKGYMESGEDEKQVRKLAAVLIPFYLGLLAKNEGIEEAAVVALSKMTGGEGFDWLVGPALRDTEPALRAAAVQALGRIGGDGAKAALENAVTSDKEPSVRAKALNALMAWKLSEVKGVVLKALKDKSWEVRALAVAICGAGNLVEAAEALIEALEEETGRLRKDIDDVLFLLVG